MVSDGTNLMHYYRLLDELAEDLANRMAEVEVERALLTGPPRTIVDPLGSVAHRGAQCSTEQILSMKKSGLTDDQVRRACGQ
jgi:hypothetical protein